jgi:hypothetical protein
VKAHAAVHTATIGSSVIVHTHLPEPCITTGAAQPFSVPRANSLDAIAHCSQVCAHCCGTVWCMCCSSAWLLHLCMAVVAGLWALPPRHSMPGVSNPPNTPLLPSLATMARASCPALSQMHTMETVSVAGPLDAILRKLFFERNRAKTQHKLIGAVVHQDRAQSKPRPVSGVCVWAGRPVSYPNAFLCRCGNHGCLGQRLAY